MVVVDTNILFSALLKENSSHGETIFLGDEKWIAPSFVVVEPFKHKEKILRYSEMPEERLLLMLEMLLKQITFIDPEQFPVTIRQEAYELCKDLDEKDTPFIAIALGTGSKIWTGDKKLINGLKAKGYNNFFSQTP